MSHSSGNPDYNLEFIAKLQRQDQSAFKKVFDDFAGLVFSRAALILGNSHSAEDVTQEVFYKAYKSLPTLKDGNVKPWLLTITRNHCFDEIRKRKRRPVCVDHPVEILAEGSIDFESEFYEIVADLPEEIRLPLMLKIVEGLKYKEIAEALNRAEGTLRNQVCKGLKILRKGLKK